MWRNGHVLEFVAWLRKYNDSMLKGEPKTGFYGLDLYSFHTSSHAVLAYRTKSIRKRLNAHGIATLASNSSLRMPKLMDMPPASAVLVLLFAIPCFVIPLVGS